MPRNLFSLVFRYLLFALLFQKDLFLQLYLLAQLFLRGQIGEIFGLEADMLLSGHKGKSLAHLHDKTLQMADDTTLQFCLRKISIGLQSKKLWHAVKTPNCGLGAATFSDC